MASENLIPIPGRLHSVATEGHVTGADEIYDDDLQKTQDVINAEIDEVIDDVALIDTTESSPAVVPGFDPTTDTVHVTAQTLSESQKAQVRTNIGLGDVDAKINEAVASEASQRAAAVSAEASRAQAAEAQLNAYIQALSKSQPVPKTAEEWAAMTSWEEGVIYRVQGTTSYADWMYNGTTTIKMAEFDNAIDDEPTAGSDNLVKSGGVHYYCTTSEEIPIDFTFHQGVINESGQEVSVYGYQISDKKAVTAGDNIHIVASGTYTNYMYIFYNGDTIISGEKAAAGGTPTVIDKVVTVPQNATTLLVSYKVSEGIASAIINKMLRMDDVIKDIYSKIPNNGNPLFGKKVVLAGDSFTESNFSQYTDSQGRQGQNSPEFWDSETNQWKGWGYFLMKNNNMTGYVDGVGGSTMTKTQRYIDGQTWRNPFSVSRYLAVPSDTDYLLLWFGLNEVVDEIGTIGDNVNTTLYGAWNIVLRHYLTNMPYMHIGMVISDGWINADIRTALLNVSQRWGIPYLDISHLSTQNVPTLAGSRDTMCQEAKDLRQSAFIGVDDHPNPECNRYKVSIIENFLRSL